MSNRLTFSLASLIVIFALAAMPAMAATIEAEWTTDLNNDANADDNGWVVTVTAADGANVTAVTLNEVQIDNAGDTQAEATSIRTALAAGVVVVEVPAIAGQRIAVQVVVAGGTDAGTYQRVVLPASANLASTTLMKLPMLMKLATPRYYLSFDNNEATVMFDFAAAGTGNGAVGMVRIHETDVTLAPDTSWVVTDTTATTVTVRSSHTRDATSTSSTVTLGATYAQPATTATDGVATIYYDNTAPATPVNVAVSALPGNFSPPDEIWGEPFLLTFAVTDEATGSGVALPMVSGPADKVMIGDVGRNPAGDDANAAPPLSGYGVRVTPIDTRTTTAGEEITLAITPMDMAGNAGIAAMQMVKLAANTYTPPTTPDATITATPAMGNVATGGTIAIAFSATGVRGTLALTNVSPAGSVSLSGTTITVDAMASTTAATTISFTLTWGANSSQGFTYTLPQGATPPPPAINIAAGGYLVITGSGFDATTLPGVTTMEVAGFPDDLAEYLVAGGTINVVVSGTTEDGVIINKGDVIINEMMVARDTRKIGSLTHDPADGQWIELYNKHGSETAMNVMVTFNQSKPAVSPAGYADRFSNVAGQGWAFLGKFTDPGVLNGSLPDANGQGAVNFVSIRRTDAGKNGSDPAAWGTAVSSLLFAPGRVGTPGGKNTVDVFSPQPNDRPIKNQVLISEVANRTNNDTEWIELKGPANKSLKNWQLSIAYKNDAGELKNDAIFNFPNNDNIKISPNGYLLLTDVSPLNGELAPDFANGVHTPVRYKNAVVTLGALPNGGNFLLILRHRKDRLNSHEGIEDIAGYANNLGVANPYKTLWPLRGNAGVLSSHNNLVGGKVYRRVRENIHGYSATAGNKLHESAFGVVGFTGLGYDRNADATNAENGGTPGYPHGNFRHNGSNAPGNVFISEIMFATGAAIRNRNLPQWIEIHNQSDTESVRLDDWRLEIINAEGNADGSAFAGPGTTNKYAEHIGLSGTIPPNQTYLIVSHIASSNLDSGRYRLPAERIKIIGKKFNETLINPYGFHLTLRANVDRPGGEHVVVDTVGNLNEATSTRRGNDRSFAGNAWELSDLGSAFADDNSRISISRRYAAWSAPMVTATGEDMAGWILTDADPRYSGLIRITYYGRTDDNATPGYTIGSALPVQLSKFSPERLDDGTVVIRWATESEKDNAGFNILRSDARDGQFTKINTQLIAGQGTTSERTAYEFTDKSAKPNVVYYYQIQDVSLDGNVETIRTSRLRGHVSAAGKATTTWGKLKALQ